MNNNTWTEAELAGLDLSWSEFHRQFPERTRHAWRHKRDAGKKNVTPRIKVPDISDAELLESVITYGAAIDKAFPFQLDHEVTVKTNQPIGVAFLSDWHIGSEGCDLQQIWDDVKLIISHPRLYCALGGDPIDNFILQKMASAARSQIANVEVQWKIFRYLLTQLYESQSLLWVSSGNHDAWTQQVAGIDGVLAAMHDMPVCYTGEGGLVRLQVGQQPYSIYRKHKPTRWRSGYNPTHFLKMMLKQGTPWEWDVGISEHIHEPEMTVFEWRPGSKLDRVAISCGTYKVRDRYATGLGYYGGGYGVPVVIFYPDRRELLAFTSLTHAITVLDAVSPAREAA